MNFADRNGHGSGRPSQGPRAGRAADSRHGGGPPGRPQTRRPPDVDHARQAALDLLAAVRSRGAYANLTLPGLLSDRGLSGRDAALATELAYGACRALGQLDAVIGACCDRPLAELDGPVLDVLRLAVYQLLHTRIPDHAAVSVSVDLVRAGPNPGAAGFVNAVLRKVSRNDLAGWIAEIGPDRRTDPLGYLALLTAHPRWITTAVLDALGAGDKGAAMTELEAALEADDVPPQVHLLARPGRISQDELMIAAGGRRARFSPFGVYLPPVIRGGSPRSPTVEPPSRTRARSWSRWHWPAPSWTVRIVDGSTSPPGQVVRQRCSAPGQRRAAPGSTPSRSRRTGPS